MIEVKAYQCEICGKLNINDKKLWSHEILCAKKKKLQQEVKRKFKIKTDLDEKQILKEVEHSQELKLLYLDNPQNIKINKLLDMIIYTKQTSMDKRRIKRLRRLCRERLEKICKY